MKLLFILLFMILLTPMMIHAEAKFKSQQKDKSWNVSIKSWTVLSWRNDQDFDTSERYYDLDGQTQGQFVTALRPAFRWKNTKAVEIFYEPEIGWESWAAVNSNMPHPYGPNRLNGLSMRHRQLWSRYQNSKVRLTAGYQPVKDPSELFLAHLTGSIRLDFMMNRITLSTWVAQLPEDQFEGIALNEDNFVHDNLIFATQFAWKNETTNLKFAGILLRDDRIVDRSLSLNVGSFNIKLKPSKGLRVRFAVAYQGGTWENSGLMGVDQKISAWGSQGGLSYSQGKFKISTNYVLLSADNQADGDQHMGSFFYTGQNDSSTLILTQDENRDRFDNLDERNATAWGSHFVHRAGLGVWDLNFGYQFTEFYRSHLVYGLGWVLEPENMLGESMLGSEFAWMNTFLVHKAFHIFLHGQVLIPQGAGVMSNDQDRTAKNTLYGFQSGIKAKF